MSRLGRFVKKFKFSPTITFHTLELIERKSFEYKIVDDLEQISILLNILHKKFQVRVEKGVLAGPCSGHSSTAGEGGFRGKSMQNQIF